MNIDKEIDTRGLNCPLPQMVTMSYGHTGNQKTISIIIKQ